MVSVLKKWFVDRKYTPQDPQYRRAYGTLCSVLGILFNLFLFSVKLFGGMISSSIAITADAFNNLSDAASSLIALIGFKMAGQKPDPDHPFGHGRIEYVSGFVVSILILLMAIELIKSSIDKLLHPTDLSISIPVVVILLLSIIIKLYMAYYNRRAGKDIQSSALHAVSYDSISDSIATLVVLLATILSHYTGLRLDGYCGLAVGLFVGWAGILAAKDTISPLLGTKPDQEFVDSIRNIVKETPEIIAIHDLIVHDYGPGRRMISLHAEVSEAGDILALHDAIDNTEHQLRNKLQCDAVIHMDPIATQDEHTMQLREVVIQLLNTIDERLNLHDFRLVKGTTHSNIIFDLVVPYDFHMTDDALTKLIALEIKKINPHYQTVIEVDKDYNS